MKNEIDNSLLIAFGKKIRFFRQNKGISQEELASLANVHRTYVGMIERGEKNVTLLTMHKFSTALNLSLSELISCEHHGE